MSMINIIRINKIEKKDKKSSIGCPRCGIEMRQANTLCRNCSYENVSAKRFSKRKRGLHILKKLITLDNFAIEI